MSSDPISSVFGSILQSESLPLLAILALCAIALSLFDKTRKGRLATSYLGGARERKAARDTALQQIAERSRNSVALYFDRPQHIAEVKAHPPALYLPNAECGICIMGGPGTGKTVSLADPLIRSAIDQGFPIILYDFKYPTQTSRLYRYARESGYKISVFAPGFPESECCNPLDFMRSPDDAVSARQIATVLNRNLKLANKDMSASAFFEASGDQLVEAVLMAAKSSAFSDVMQCQAILSIPGLQHRIQSAIDEDRLSYWIGASFSQLLSVKDAAQTVGGILGTANILFTRFMKPSILSNFCGKTTLPLDLSGKRMIVFGMDRDRRDVVGPLLAVVLERIISRNVAQRRKDPLIVSIDELPTLYLPNLSDWLNQNREDGLCMITAIQNMVQLKKTYGDDESRAIIGGHATKVIFNPQELDSADYFSRYVGDEEVHFHSKTKGTSAGKASSSISDQDRTRRLYEVSRLLKLPRGKCLIINPGYSNERESSVPIEQKILIPKEVIKAFKNEELSWPQISRRLVALRRSVEPTAEDMRVRFKEADRIFAGPAPKLPETSTAKPLSKKEAAEWANLL